jgi:dihydropteroate synthase-like protein
VISLRVLVVTGKLAEESVRRKINGSVHEVEIFVIPVTVAAFITPQLASKALSELDSDFDIILIPGTVRGDVTIIEETTGIPTYKGPSNADDLPILLEFLDEIQLSKTEFASTILEEARAKKADHELKKIERDWRMLLKKQGGLVIGRQGRELPVGKAFPMRVIAEIVNAPNLEMEQIVARARYFESEGADIVDIGMLAGQSNPHIIRDIVETVKSTISLPVSIDTLDPHEIISAIDAGIDLVLSIDKGNMHDVAPHINDLAVVVLPSNMKEGYLSKRAEERVADLLDNIKIAQELGIEKIIADPILEPAVKPGLLESLNSYKIFRETNQEIPVLYGLGNVTELIDIDSPGVNGLLAALAAEVGANILFVPEFSVKARKSVREVARAAQMMYLAEKMEKPPKDLGIDLLILKEKRWKEFAYDPLMEKDAKVKLAQGDEDLVLDDMGYFRIQVDREKDLIVVSHYNDASGPKTVIKGKKARAIYQTIIREELVGKYDHAAYLGKELAKAELAILLGRSYTQDDPLF